MKITFLLFSFCTASLVFSQEPIQRVTDKDGRISFFISERVQSPPPGSQKPDDLNLNWSEPDFDVSDNRNVDSWDPRLSTGSDGTVNVVYNDNHSSGLQKIMFRKKTGNTWSTPIFVDKGGDIGSRNNHFPAIGEGSNGDLHVIYNVWAYENVRNFIGYSRYDAASDTWLDGVKISDLGGTVNHTDGRHEVYVAEDNNPVAIWGYDNRANTVNEEIYLTYFNGTNWSPDIAVSDVTDGFDAGRPYAQSIGNKKMMIVYAEGVDSQTKELRYRIYDEVTHELSAAKRITSEKISDVNYSLSRSGTGSVRVLTYSKIQGTNKDLLSVYDYDISDDTFSLSSHSAEIRTNTGGLLIRMEMDCNSGGDCGIILLNAATSKISYLPLNKESGFGSPQVIAEQEVTIDHPAVRFDTDGNLHTVWPDLRFDPGGTFMAREVIYKKGKNGDLGVATEDFKEVKVYPNPAGSSVTVSAPDFYRLDIYDAMGRHIKTHSISGISDVDLSLTNGLYFMKFSNNKRSQTLKLVVNR